MIEKTIIAISSIIVAIITSFLSIRFYKLEKKINNISKKLDIEENKKEILKSFQKARDFFLKKILDKEYQIAYMEKVECFIDRVKQILELKDYSIDNYESTECQLDKGFYFANARMREYLPALFVDRYYKKHYQNYLIFRKRIKEIFMDIKNNKQNRIIEECYNFFIHFSELYLETIKEE